MKHVANLTEEYQPEWLPDYKARLYKSTAKLAAAKRGDIRWAAIGDVGPGKGAGVIKCCSLRSNGQKVIPPSSALI